MPFLDWVNKNEAAEIAKNIPYHLIKTQKVYGDQTENLLIEGDNLVALKALIPLYAEKIKCVCIDPPYNTQSAFSHYDDKLEHSQWLSMMYPRLTLLRELMSTDGSIWITIDDDEAHYLKVVCDEIFGRKNFVANAIWQKKYAPQNDAKWLSDSHDHILIYAKNKNSWRPYGLPRTLEMNERYRNPDNDPRGPWMSDNLTVRTYSVETDYPITTPSGRVVNPPAGSCWRLNKQRFKEFMENGRIWFGADGGGVPRIKRFLSEVQQNVVSKTIWLRDEVGDNQDAKREVRVFNPTDVFDTPKPESLIKRILDLSTKPGDFVIDSYLGSGTTAAVCHKMGRQYIGIEMGKHIETHCIPRLREVIEGENGGISKLISWGGGGGFNFCTLAAPIFNADGSINSEVKFQNLASFIWHMETNQASNKIFDSPLLGMHDGVAYFLLYNGILGDKRPDSGNVLTSAVLRAINEILPHDGSKVIYGESTKLGQSRLTAEGITFKQIPYDINIL